MKISLTLLLFLTTYFGIAQDTAKSRVSPVGITSARYKNSYIKITYGQPQKRGREIFGGIVPFGQVWRTGANEATEMTLTKDIYINGVIVKAGTYSVFTIPDRIKWTIIINSEPGLWGSYNYNQKLDVIRFDVPIQTLNEVLETFTIKIDQNNDKAELSMAWDHTKVTLPIRFIDAP